MSERDNNEAAILRIALDIANDRDVLKSLLGRAHMELDARNATDLSEICRLDSLIWQTADEAAALASDLDDLQAEWAAESQVYDAIRWGYKTRVTELEARIAEMEGVDQMQVVSIDTLASEVEHRAEDLIEANGHIDRLKQTIDQLRIDLKAADEYTETLQVENHSLGETVTRYGARIKWLEDNLGEESARLIEDNTRLRMQPYEESKRIQEAVAALRAMASLDVELTPAGILAVANRLHSGPRAPSIPRHVQPPIEEMDA